MFSPAVPVPMASRRPPVVLVVEDKGLIRMALADYLRDCGYRVFEAADVQEAKAVLTADTEVSLVFSDIQMPGTADGFELARWVRTHHPNVPVILASGRSDATSKARDVCHEGPIVSKPYEHTVALRRIQELLRTSGGAAPRSAIAR